MLGLDFFRIAIQNSITDFLYDVNFLRVTHWILLILRRKK